MNMTPFNKTGLKTLLTPENSALILIDHQPFQFASLNSHDPQTIINNVVGLAKVAKLFKVPTLLMTVTEERGGYLLKQLQDVFAARSPSIARSSTPGRTSGSLIGRRRPEGRSSSWRLSGRKSASPSP
jgi:nicotinamidase-related amidase